MTVCCPHTNACHIVAECRTAHTQNVAGISSYEAGNDYRYIAMSKSALVAGGANAGRFGGITKDDTGREFVTSPVRSIQRPLSQTFEIADGQAQPSLKQAC